DSAIYRSLWQSLHPLRPAAPSSDTITLPRLFDQHGYQTTLITDERSLFEFTGAGDFQNAIEVSPSLTDLFAAASDQLRGGANQRTSQPQMVWLPARGMYGPWQAPVEYQETLLDEEDPPPLEVESTPELVLSKNEDPDTAFRYACAYAAQ